MVVAANKAATLTTMSEKTRLRLLFDDRRMLNKSKKKEGLKRCWFLLKPHLNTISDLSSHLLNVFRLHRTCPHGITLLMDGFVLPSFESTCILKDKDIVCVKRKGSVLISDSKPAMLPSETHENQSIELPKLLAIEGVQEERGEYETVSLDEDDNDQSEDVVYVESKPDGNAVSKKRKASKKLKSPRQKKIKMSTTENIAVISENHDEENGISQTNKSSNPDSIKQKSDKSGPTRDETRSIQPLDEDETKKLPSRSARRKKAKRKWLRELKLEKGKEKEKEEDEEKEKEKEKEKEQKVIEKDDKKVPIKDNNCVASDVHQQSEEESGADEDMVPVEIRPGHIRFQPRGKEDQAVAQNQFPVDTFQWSGTTSKKKGQKWGKERISSHKQDDYAQTQSSQACLTVQNAEKKHTFDAVDFEKLTPYTDLPKKGNVIAYRLIELSESWTPELSSFRVGKITQYDSKSNRIWLEPVSEFPFDFRKKIDDTDDNVSPAPPDLSPYQEDGSLEIDYTSLADVRIIKNGYSDLATVGASSDAFVTPTKAINNSTDEKRADNQTAVGNWKPQKEVHIPAKENGEVNVWEEINEALKAKKAKLSQGDGWRKEDDSSGNRSWSQRALRCSALGPTMALLRSQNGFKK